jgi:hypothetical protein
VNSGLPVDAATPTVVILIDPAAPDTVYTGFDGAGVFRSENSGGSWTGAATQPANLRVKAVVIHPSTRSTLYAATYGGGVFKSADRGMNWTVCAAQPAHLNVISLTIDAGGRLYGGTEAGVSVSGDGCASWTAINGGLP